MPDIELKNRSIRSFVRRSGRLTPSQKNAIEHYWQFYGIESCAQPIELPTGFTSLKLEIGIGNGDALIAMASADTQSLYIGIEVHEPGIGRCLNNIHKLQLSNIRLVCSDAVEVLTQMIKPASLDRLLLFFPDPWHKKRHHKRRIVNQQFRDLISNALKPGAVFHAATDWENYAEHIAGEFLGDPRFNNCGDSQGYTECPEYRPLTKFEARGRRLGHGVWDLMFALK
ncbi:MAG: tRNA (guanine-N7-)-methyltransferase [Gammaproteobacteria bacterium]|jgi:tRNA (guanine-N7-)-methyltransferase